MAIVQDAQARSVRVARSSDVARAGATLADALADDPFSHWVLGDVPDRVRRMTPGFAAIVREEARAAEPLVFLAEEGASVAVWKGVDAWRQTGIAVLRTLPGIVRSCRLGTPRLLRALVAAERAHPTEPHYYLSYLGTRSDRQGEGLGAVALEPMLDRCDAEGLPAYLESSNPRNRRFYLRQGFVEQGELEMPRGCPPVVAMRRDPH